MPLLQSLLCGPCLLQSLLSGSLLQSPLCGLCCNPSVWPLLQYLRVALAAIPLCRDAALCRSSSLCIIDYVPLPLPPFFLLVRANSPCLPPHPLHRPPFPTHKIWCVAHIRPCAPSLAHLQGCGYECGRKTFRWDNGPQGFGDGSRPGSTTQWPCSLNMGATWDPTLALQWGTAMGEEFWGKGTNIQEGPGVNVARINKNGRTFEYVSGEDPVLGSALVAPIVTGIQKNVMAISKHYILNNQETDRSGVNELVDEQTIMELYAPPFATAAQHSAGFMCSYNRINGVWACENKDTLRTMLKGYFNFS